MRRIWLAIRAFFLVLFQAEVARQVESVLVAYREPEALQVPTTAPEAPQAAAAKKPSPVKTPAATRSEALTLLAVLQREARLIDFVKEPLDGYSDAQVGAAARNVHRDCAAALDRLFALQPLLETQEGEQIEVPVGFDPGCYQLTGKVTGEPPFSGKLIHRGWKVTLCQLPAWSGSAAAAEVIAPSEVELR